MAIQLNTEALAGLLDLIETGRIAEARTALEGMRHDADHARALHPLAREAATEIHAGNDLQIDEDPALTPADGGCWVEAWVWVSDEDMMPVAATGEVATHAPA